MGLDIYLHKYKETNVFKKDNTYDEVSFYKLVNSINNLTYFTSQEYRNLDKYSIIRKFTKRIFVDFEVFDLKLFATDKGMKRISSQNRHFEYLKESNSFKINLNNKEFIVPYAEGKKYIKIQKRKFYVAESEEVAYQRGIDPAGDMYLDLIGNCELCQNLNMIREMVAIGVLNKEFLENFDVDTVFHAWW